MQDDCSKPNKGFTALPVVDVHLIPWCTGVLPGVWNNKHFLVIVDAYSKWPEVKVVSTTTTQRTIEVLQDVFATHGFPRLLVSDNGPQFTSEEFGSFLHSHNIVHHKSPPYHPATNGLAENMVKNVKQWLKKQGKGTNVSCAVSDFLRTYRNVPHTSTNRTPAEIIFRREPRTHLSMVVPSMTERLKEDLEPQDGFKPPRSFSEGDTVWVRDHRPTSSHKWIQGMVLSKVGALSYVVDLEGHQRKVHVDHLLQRSSPSQDMQVSTFKVKGNPASTTQSATTGGTGPEPAPPQLERPAVPTSPGDVQRPQDEPLAPQLPQSGTQPVPANPQLPVPQAEPQPTQAESQVVKEAHWYNRPQNP